MLRRPDLRGGDEAPGVGDHAVGACRAGGHQAAEVEVRDLVTVLAKARGRGLDLLAAGDLLDLVRLQDEEVPGGAGVEDPLGRRRDVVVGLVVRAGARVVDRHDGAAQRLDLAAVQRRLHVVLLARGHGDHAAELLALLRGEVVQVEDHVDGLVDGAHLVAAETDPTDHLAGQEARDVVGGAAGKACAGEQHHSHAGRGAHEVTTTHRHGVPPGGGNAGQRMATAANKPPITYSDGFRKPMRNVLNEKHSRIQRSAQNMQKSQSSRYILIQPT